MVYMYYFFVCSVFNVASRALRLLSHSGEGLLSYSLKTAAIGFSCKGMAEAVMTHAFISSVRSLANSILRYQNCSSFAVYQVQK